MKKLAYTYTVLRYVHDTSTGEFANVGVVMVCPEERYADAILRPTHGRFSQMFPGTLTLVPLYIIIVEWLHLGSNYLGLILLYATTAFVAWGLVPIFWNEIMVKTVAKASISFS